MSLQVWLPLIGNTKNQGLSNITMTGSPASYDVGKIGQTAATWNGVASNCIYNNTTEFNYTDNFSFALWIYPIYTGSTTQYVFTVGRADTGGYGYGLYVPNATQVTFRFANKVLAVSCPSNTWHHLAMVVQGTEMKCYVDGNLSGTQTVGTIPTYSDGNGLGIGSFHYSSNIYPFYGRINDFRIYDHALSPKEVKEISKGLVAHYPLDDFVGNENLFKLDSIGTSTVLTITNNVIKVKATNNTYCGFGGNRMDFVAGTTYTVSCHVKVYSKDSNWEPRITIRNSSNVIQASAITTASEYDKFLTLTYTPSTTITNGYVSGIITGGTAASAETDFSNIKCEVGSKSTPYIPATTDRIYSTAGYGGSIVYDTSGYGNNGTMSSTKPTVDSDSIRYKTCMLFNGSSSYIACGRGGMVRDAITVNWWGYMSDWSSYARGISCTEGGGWNFEPNSGYMQFAIGMGESSNTYKSLKSSQQLSALSAGWHMFTGTYDGLNTNIYVDGVNKGTATPFTTKTLIYYHTSNGIFIGAEAGSNITTGYSPFFNGKISDVRIYATALSATDIKELYNTSASITNTGAVMAFDFEEV